MRVEVSGNNQEFIILKRQLQRIPRMHVRAELVNPYGKGVAFAVTPPFDVFIAAVGTIGSIAKLAEILFRYLKKRNHAGARTATLRFNGKEMTVKGDWNKGELESILKEFSKTLSRSDSRRKIQLIERHRKKELRQELKELRAMLPTYLRLAKIGHESANTSGETRRKLHAYQKREREIRSRISALERILGSTR